MDYRASIETVGHDEQRYETVGDWICGEGGSVVVKVSAMSDWRYEFLVGLHELVEAAWCRQNGVSQERVDVWDLEFEKQLVGRVKQIEQLKTVQQAGDIKQILAEYQRQLADAEPGDEELCPYHDGHKLASQVERQVSEAIGVEWERYDAEVQSFISEKGNPV